MLSFFKRQSQGLAKPTFKTRVGNFWRWYAEVSPRLYKTIEDKRCSDLAPEINAKVDELISGCAWVFGVGAEGKGHSFTLTGEGNPHRQFLTEFWKQQAPSLDGWTFYSSRQPTRPFKGWSVEIAGQTFDALEFWLAPRLDRDSEKIDLTVWHPLFGKIPKRECWSILFLMLDEALGEFGTQSWIGQIEMSDRRLAEAFPLKELPAFVSTTEAEAGWKKFPPTETWTLYELNERHERFRRGDVIAGMSANIALINEFLGSEDQLEDPLAGSGADYIFVRFDAQFLPKGKEVEARGKIEEDLEASLFSAKSGRHIGGALGKRFAYIDLLLFDGTTSLEIVKETLSRHELPKGASIEFFAKEKRDQRILLS